MLQRVLEPELMDDPQEAIAYDEMDHSDVNRRFVDDLLADGPCGIDVLDIGTGTARIPIELCRRDSRCRVFASDGAKSMLEVARYNIAIANLEHRVQLHYGDAKSLNIADASFDTVISNSLLHHLPDPALAIAEIQRLTRPDGQIFVRDLCRPDNALELDELVVRITGNEAPAAQQMFRQSLQAALTLQEIRDLVTCHGHVSMTSDRHWTWKKVSGTFLAN